MPQLTIAETDNITTLQNGSGQCMILPPKAEQVVPVSGSANQSSPFGASWAPALDQRIIFIRINTDTACCIKVGPAGSTVATTSNARLAPNQTEYFGVINGSVLSVIQTV